VTHSAIPTPVSASAAQEAVATTISSAQVQQSILSEMVGPEF
jgi:hypothetical protein